jgi:hypothetical protein
MLENSMTGVSIGRKPKRSKLRRIASSIDWNATWSSGRSSSTPGIVRACVTAIGFLAGPRRRPAANVSRVA